MDNLKILNDYANGDKFQRPVEWAINEITKLRAENEALRLNDKRLNFICSKGVITAFIFKALDSDERHVYNAIDQAMKG
jgi:hypothetical protein